MKKVEGDLNTATFAGVLVGKPEPFCTAVRKTPGCSFVLLVQEDKDGPANSIPMVVHGKMALRIFPKLQEGQRFLVQAKARFKKPSSSAEKGEPPHFSVTSIVTLV